MSVMLAIATAALGISATELPRCEVSVEDALSFVAERQLTAKHGTSLGRSEKFLDLSRSGVTDDDLPRLCSLTWITKLTLSNDAASQKLTGENLQYLGHLTQLKELDLADNALPMSALAALAPLQKLNRLTLDRNPLDGLGIEMLNQMSSLETLSMCDSNITDDKLTYFARLAGHPALKHLNLAGNQITTAGLFSLRTLRVEHLDLTGNALNIPDPGAVDALTTFENIVNFSNLAAMPTLKDLRVGNNERYKNHHNVLAAPEALLELRNAQSLERLFVEGLRLSSVDILVLLQIPNLRILDLSHADFEPTSLIAAVRHPKLRCLILPGHVDWESQDVIRQIQAQAPQLDLTGRACATGAEPI